MSLSPNIVASKVAMSQRWLKLYRTIFHRFLKKDIVHKKDYMQDIASINTRFSELETKLTTELTKLQAGLATHIHVAPQAPAGTIPTLPPSAPPYTSGFSPTKPIVHKEINLEQEDAMLQATGPSMAPLGDGMSPEAQAATIEVKTDIGLT